MSDDAFSQAGEVVQKLFNKIVNRNNADFPHLYSNWKSIVGTDMAFHVVPKDVRNGVLLLETDHPGWSQKIRMDQVRILGRIQYKYPELSIAKIAINVDSGSIQNEKIQETENIPYQMPANIENKGKDEDFFRLLSRMKQRSKP